MKKNFTKTFEVKVKQIPDHFHMTAAFGRDKLLQGVELVIWKVVCSCYHDAILLLVFVIHSDFTRKNGEQDAEQQCSNICVHVCMCLWMHVRNTDSGK